MIQPNLVIRNFLVTLKLFLNAKCSLSLWSKLTIGHGKWFLNTNLFLIKTFLITKFDCISEIIDSCFFWSKNKLLCLFDLFFVCRIYMHVQNFSNFSWNFQNPFFSNLYYNCSNVLDLRNLQERVKNHWVSKIVLIIRCLNTFN